MELFKPQPSSKFTREQKQIIEETHKYMRQHYDNYDISASEKLARIFFNATDLDGFCIDLHDVYELIGYRHIHNARKKLKASTTKLRQGIDYREDCDLDVSVRMGKQKSGSGGRNKKIILLTSRGFCQFALSAQTDNGVALRDFIQYMTSRMKQVLSKLAKKNVSVTANGDRADWRLDACESQKGLMEIVHSLGIPEKIIVNGESNHTVTGKTKREMMDELGLSHKKVKSVTARDYMTKDQLCAINLLEKRTAKRLQDIGERSKNDAIDIHKDVCSNYFGPEGLAELRSQDIEDKLDLKMARNIKTIQDKK